MWSSFYAYCQRQLERFSRLRQKILLSAPRWRSLVFFVGVLGSMLVSSGLLNPATVSAGGTIGGCGPAPTEVTYQVKVVADISASFPQNQIPTTDTVQTSETEKTAQSQCNPTTVHDNRTATKVGTIKKVTIQQKSYWEITYETPSLKLFGFPDDGTNFPTVCDTVLSNDSDTGCRTTTSNDYPHSSGGTNIVTLGGQTDKPGTTITSQNPGSGNGGAPTCDSSASALSWLFCPLITGLANAADGLYSVFIHPLLVTPPLVLTNDPNDPNHTVEVWSQFRVYADIFLVAALVIIVIVQAGGGGQIDAYTIKKVVPRIVIAVVASNGSLYIIAFAVDVTNVVGAGIGNLIQAPFRDSGTFHLSFTGTTSGLGLGALAGGSIWAITSVGAIGGAATLALIGPLLEFVFMMFLLPAFLILMAILGVILLRRALIVFLLFVAPIAFALYCLPNTEQYFRKWWDLLLKTLLIYPIMAMLFALGNVLSVVINTSGKTTGLAQPLNDLLSIIALFVPIAMSAYSFTIAGGALGKLHEFATAGRKKLHGGILGSEHNERSLRNRLRHGATASVSDIRDTRKSMASRSRFAWRRRAGAFGAAKLAERQAVRNAESSKTIANTWGSGNDTFNKASTIPVAVLAARRGTARHRAATADRAEQWQSADGAWFTEAQIRQGQRYYHTRDQMQENYKQLLGKAEPLGAAAQDAVFEDYLDWANHAGLDSGNATGTWQGISIPHKGVRLDLRRARIAGTPGRLERPVGNAGTDQTSLMTEYSGMAMPEQYKETPETFRALGASMEEAFATGTGARAPAIARTAAEQANMNAVAGRAWENLKSYVNGAPPPAALGAVPPGGPGGGAGGGPAAYASASSAAAKNRQGAQQVYNAIEGTPMQAWLEANFGATGTD